MEYKDVDHHEDHQEVGEHHHPRHSTADGQAVPLLASSGGLQSLLLLVPELPGEGAVPAQQEDPQDGEGDRDNDQHEGRHQGQDPVLGVAGVDPVGGRVVSSHLHLGPEIREDVIDQSNRKLTWGKGGSSSFF